MRLNLGFAVNGEEGRKETYYLNITRAKVVERIKNHQFLDSWTKDHLVRKVNDYPDNALSFFVQNVENIVAAALNERSKALKENHGDGQADFDENDGLPSGGGPQEAEATQKDRDALFSAPG